MKFELDKDEPVNEQKAEMQRFKPTAPKPLENKPKANNVANVEKKQHTTPGLDLTNKKAVVLSNNLPKVKSKAKETFTSPKKATAPKTLPVVKPQPPQKQPEKKDSLATPRKKSLTKQKPSTSSARD